MLYPYGIYPANLAQKVFDPTISSAQFRQGRRLYDKGLMNDTYSIHSPMLDVEVKTGHTIIDEVDSVGVKNVGG